MLNPKSELYNPLLLKDNLTLTLIKMNKSYNSQTLVLHLAHLSFSQNSGFCLLNVKNVFSDFLFLFSPKHNLPFFLTPSLKLINSN